MATKDANGDLHSENNGRFVSKEEQEAKREQAERIYNSEPEPIEKGKSESSENKKMTPAEKIASVHIDFDRDNILPELNDEDLEKIGLKEHLSPTRSNGLLAMVKQMRMYALAFKAKMQEQQS